MRETFSDKNIRVKNLTRVKTYFWLPVSKGPCQAQLAFLVWVCDHGGQGRVTEATERQRGSSTDNIYF